jgi:hypothetical protein
MSDSNVVVAVYNAHTEAEKAIKELQEVGFDMKKLSIVGKDYHTEEHVVGFYNTGDRMKFWGKLGAFWGGLSGLLFGGLFLVPGIGHVMILGPLAGWIVGALESAAIAGGLSAIGGGLVSLGIPRNSVLQYETAIKAGKFLVIVHGTPEEAARARKVFRTAGAAALDLHQPAAA